MSSLTQLKVHTTLSDAYKYLTIITYFYRRYTLAGSKSCHVQGSFQQLYGNVFDFIVGLSAGGCTDGQIETSQCVAILGLQCRLTKSLNCHPVHASWKPVQYSS